MPVSKTAIIAAMPQELAPLVRGWSAIRITMQNREVRLWESEQAIAACGGIGMISARIAAEAVWHHSKGSVREFISAGYAGALIPEFKVGEVFIPEEIVESVDDQRLRTVSGSGILVT